MESICIVTLVLIIIAGQVINTALLVPSSQNVEAFFMTCYIKKIKHDLLIKMMHCCSEIYNMQYYNVLILGRLCPNSW
jgi:hypothetical protein